MEQIQHELYIAGYDVNEIQEAMADYVVDDLPAEQTEDVPTVASEEQAPKGQFDWTLFIRKKALSPWSVLVLMILTSLLLLEESTLARISLSLGIVFVKLSAFSVVIYLILQATNETRIKFHDCILGAGLIVFIDFIITNAVDIIYPGAGTAVWLTRFFLALSFQIVIAIGIFLLMYKSTFKGAFAFIVLMWLVNIFIGAGTAAIEQDTDHYPDRGFGCSGSEPDLYSQGRIIVGDEQFQDFCTKSRKVRKTKECHGEECFVMDYSCNYTGNGYWNLFHCTNGCKEGACTKE